MKLAVLIDADNAQAGKIERLLAEVAAYGTASVKKAYGDWTTPGLKSWKEVLHEHAVQPVQQFAYTTGKNSTDSALIIDAMDMLYSRTFDGFCIVSSDSDYTRLATRLREAGLVVYGFGERKTPAPFVKSCDRFIYTEVLTDKNGDADAPGESTRTPAATNELKGDAKLVSSLRFAVESSSDEEGWAFLGMVGNHVQKSWPEFDTRNYGYAKLSNLIEAIQLFDVRAEQLDNKTKKIFIRDQRKKK